MEAELIKKLDRISARYKRRGTQAKRSALSSETGSQQCYFQGLSDAYFEIHGYLQGRTKRLKRKPKKRS